MRHSASISLRVPVVALLASSRLRMQFMPEGDGAALTTIAALKRYAVKGLDHDELERVDLQVGGGFPHDRAWALQYEDASDAFEPTAPTWVHKAAFLCSFTANELMAT